jgi:hypothetical protein
MVGIAQLFERGAGQGNVTTTLTAVAKVAVNGAEAIEGRWYQAGGTGNITNRSLMIIEVAA